VRAVIVDGDDVAMLEFRHHLRFTLEAFDEARVAGVMFRQNLESDETVHARLVGFINGSHTTESDLFKYLISAES